MISVILLILTLILIVIGGICGFRRGIIKEGVRVVLWGVLFAGSCFYIPNLVDQILLWFSGRFGMNVADVEQLADQLLKKIEILKKETYLILPMAGFARTLLIPFLTIVFFWAAGLFSWILFLFVSLFLRKLSEKQGVAVKLTGLVLGLIFALFSGAVTLYPLAAAGSAIKEGDSAGVLGKEFAAVDFMADAYEGSAVKIIYRFTGTEFLGKSVHNLINTSEIAEEAQNIWVELPQLVRVGSEGWKLYTSIVDKNAAQSTIQEYMPGFLDAYFSLNFISDDNKMVLLKHMKETLGDSMNQHMLQNVLDWLEIQNKEQFISDVSTYVRILDILRQDGILDTVQNGKEMPVVSEETGEDLITALYQLSNAEVVVPEFINLIYSTILSGAEKQLITTEKLIWNEETKADISEVVSVICKLSKIVGQIDSLTMEEKMTALDAVKALKDNNAVGKENYAALLKYIMGML